MNVQSNQVPQGKLDPLRCLESVPMLPQPDGEFSRSQAHDWFHEIVEQAVAKRTAELTVANESLARANRVKSEFLANMSHEIRTPLTIILCYAEMLKQDCGESPAAAEALTNIKQSGDHLLEIINDLLDLSKIEAEKLDIESIPCSPIQLLADVDSLMRVRSEGRGLRFLIEYGGAIPATIHSDPTRLRQILINLVGNAIKFTERGHVRLITELTQGPGGEPLLKFDVVDTGIGMSRDQLERLFQPYSQAESSTARKYGGTGLGLSISKRLSEMLGGELTVESTLGVGSRFSVVIPTGPLAADDFIDRPSLATTVMKEERVAELAAAPSTLGCRILLAEDRSDSRRLITKLLTVAGATVTAVENGEVAVRIALDAQRTREPFDVVIMDMQMPLLDGYAAAGLLRQKGYSGAIVALTAHAMAGDEEKCLEAGCDDYMSKPVERKKLVALVAKYQRRELLDEDRETAP